MKPLNDRFPRGNEVLLVDDHDDQSDERVNDYLLPNILATLLCCPIFGVVGIAYSLSACGARRRGDWIQARIEAENAKSYFWWAFGLGLACVAVYLVNEFLAPGAFVQ